MKKKLLLIFFSTLPFLSIAQKLKTITKKFSNNNATEIEYKVLKKKKYVKHGAYKKYFENGQIREIGVYDNSKKHGDWKEFSNHNELRRIRKYEKGKLISDKKHGTWREVGQNGKPYFYNYNNNERVIPPIPIPIKYPQKAREEGIAGIVKIKVLLDEQCNLKELKVVNSLRSDFDTEAIKGVEKFIEKLQSYEDDCKGFEEIITIEFKVD